MRAYTTTIVVTDDDGNDAELVVTGWWLLAGEAGTVYGDTWEDIQIFKDGAELSRNDVSDWVVDMAEEALYEALKDEHERRLESKAEYQAVLRDMDARERFHESEKFNGGW